MWPRELFALSWAVLALGVAAGQRNPSKGGGQPARSWNRRAFDMLQGKVVCQRQAGPGWGRHPLGKGETDCSLWGSAGRSGQARSAGEKRDFMARARARGCLGKWEREMVRNLLADLPPPTYSRCGAEQGALRRNFKQRFHLHLLHQVIAMPLIQVSWKEAIELEFQTPAGKEALTKVKLYGTFLVFFLDEEKDWLPHQERNFSISIKKGRWSKHELVCVTDDSKYIILELPAKACEWFCSPSLQISMQMRPLCADTEEETTFYTGYCSR
ncbi:uncharacterized protein [Narcine bancroftii]|uniref:uncharacterized protein isoform X2 n=1 Tax=Narcine bancroftii TaxID=1343680 RepID=UPI003831A8CC